MITSKFTAVLFFLLIFFLFPARVFADEDSQFITVVNPVRISIYTKNPKESLASQYQIILKNNLPATWLLTYDAINDDGIYSVVESMDAKQELGIFLEVTPKLAADAKVGYHSTGFWHHATSVFLSGYLQEERRLLIDKVFERFKERFGYYPTSVGSWWTDSYSLVYMQEKYGIIANLGVADQFSMDGYKVWGQSWSIPFYPSRLHAGIPARTVEVKLDLVTMQWAPRDPLNGYFDSLYSTQDYFVKDAALTTDYFKKIVELYAGRGSNIFGQVVVGLEGDLPPSGYKGEYENQMKMVAYLGETGEYEITNMRKFANWYREKFKELSPPQIIETDDLLGKPQKVIWYQSPAFRLGLVYDKEKKETKIFDFRTYHTDLQEPYYLSPNKQFTLSVYIPSYFDELNNPADVWKLNLGELVKIEEDSSALTLVFDSGCQIKLTPEKITFLKTDVDVPEVVSKSSAVAVKFDANSIEIEPRKNWLVGIDGWVYRDLTFGATHLLATRRVRYGFIIAGIFFIGVSYAIILSKFSERTKTIVLTILILPVVSFLAFWYKGNTASYFVSQGEVDALYRLSLLPEGRVVVYNRECLWCEWHTKYEPAAFANKRGYVARLGSHPIVYNLSVFVAKNQKEAREEFQKLNAKYIYLAKYEDVIEKTPFSPGDLGIEKIYDNANAEIWRVKGGE